MNTEARGRAAAVLDAAVQKGAFPGAVAETGSSSGPLWHHATGRLTYEADAAAVRAATLYDLASLTKAIATATIAMRLIERGTLSLDAHAITWMPEWREGAFSDVRVRDLLEHSSGLPGWLPLFRTYQPTNLPTTAHGDMRRAIAALPPEYQPRTKAVYSDLGFIVLGHVLQSIAGRPLDEQFDEFRIAASLPATLAYGVVAQAFLPAVASAKAGRPATIDIAPTEFDPWRGRLLIGEVHDENAFVLGGVAPQAGLFGTAADVGAFARLVLQTFREPTVLGTPQMMRLFARRSTVPGSSRALGWDTMLPTSSCGTRMSPDAIGHTGFTGTSLWIDHARDAYFVLLSNRVHPTRENNQIQDVRRAFHEALTD